MMLFLGLIIISLTSVLGVNNRNIHEGESCQLPNANPGVCRKIMDCLHRDPRSPSTLCKSSGHFRVVCCPPDAIAQAKSMCELIPIHVESRIKPHIVGNAEIAEVGEFPFMGLLMYNDPTMRCGAVLITNKLLLTAAHCFRRENATQVRLGTNAATDEGAEPYGIASIVTHPDYKPKKKQQLSIMADLAIVKLAEEADPDEPYIAPLCLCRALEDLPPSKNLTIVGWGTTDTSTKSTADTLMKGTVQTSSHSKCQESYMKIKKTRITSSHLCAQGDADSRGVHTDACWGDSGGPLVKLEGSKYVLVGIVSSGHHCGLKDFPGVYTRVASYLDWIMNEISRI
ncbi:coagulation factor XII [Culex quinquefasciatus]|uniref:Coagulation factor XII n=1 Tax=Culex quinquefasciatus TaxID=7176 RepID=B0X821_CULQU|nr:venom protease [Culex quinquefasciatus]EDS42290.1 coagulation factor XII [Culex quinquefasciatus]|eukprot:XP_001865793.1 coagulation factor XII [Culex quinquefasciatus]